MRREPYGFPYVMELICTVSPMGKAYKRRLMPYQNEKALQEELRKTKAFSDHLRMVEKEKEEVRHLLSDMKDLQGLMQMLLRGETLSVVDLYEVKLFARQLRQMAKPLQQLNLEEKPLHSLEGVELLLDPEKEDLATFYIYEVYDDRLKNLREEKRALETAIRKAVDGSKRTQLLLERRSLVVKEEEQEEEIRERLSKALVPFVEKMQENLTLLGRLDFFIGKAEVARNYQLPLPKVSSSGPLSMVEGIHPYFEKILAEKNQKLTPITLSLVPGSTAITGANMGGKSMSLKTLFLNATLVMKGILPFAKEMSMPLIEHLYLLDEDQEEMKKGLSSFGGEVLKIQEMLGSLTLKPSLIIMDEPARGTNPLEGSAIVGGLLNYFKGRPHFFLVATHYDLKNMSGISRYQVRGLQDASLEDMKGHGEKEKMERVKELQSLMDYRLEKWDGEPILGDAIRISEFLGFSGDLIKEIRNLL